MEMKIIDSQKENLCIGNINLVKNMFILKNSSDIE